MLMYDFGTRQFFGETEITILLRQLCGRCAVDGFMTWLTAVPILATSFTLFRIEQFSLDPKIVGLDKVNVYNLGVWVLKGLSCVTGSVHAFLEGFEGWTTSVTVDNNLKIRRISSRRSF